MNINRLLANKNTIPVLAGVAGVINGGVVGYLLGKRDARINITVGEDETIDSMNVPLPFDDEHHVPEIISFDRPPARVVITPEKAAEIDVETFVRANPGSDVTKEALSKVLGTVTSVSETDNGFVVDGVLNDEGRALADAAAAEYAAAVDGLKESIFDNPHEEWDWEAETAKRGLRDPYVITDDEFHSEESGFRQTSLRYYAGDNQVVDEDGAPMINYPDILGDELKFGKGSKGHDVVFIRNPRLEQEYEVIRDYDSFAHAVMGIEAEETLDEELVHSMHPVRRARED